MSNFVLRHRFFAATLFAIALGFALPECVQAQTPCTDCVGNIVANQTGSGWFTSNLTLQEPSSSGHAFATLTQLSSSSSVLPVGTYPVWCATSTADALPENTVLNYTANSTFNLGGGTLWNSINYILNHKGALTVFEVQKAIWMVRGTNTGSRPANSVDLAAAATSPAGQSYVPGPGDKIAIYIDNPAGNQDVLVEIDYRCARLGDFIWLDSNADGIQQVGEPGINGVTVELKDSIGTVLATAVTGPAPSPFTTNGYYQFANLCPGTYYVSVNTSQNALQSYIPTQQIQGLDRSVDSNLNPTSTTLGPNGNDQTLDFGFTAFPAPTLACSLNSGQQGNSYSSSLTATGGVPGYTYSIVPADGLPPTLSLNPSTGLITGTLTAFGNFGFTAKVVDSRGNEAGTTTTTCNIDVAPPTLTATCAPDMNGQVGTLYSAFVTASGGSGGFSYAVTGGSLPAGLTLNPATGEISGTPTDYGTFQYQVTVTDNGGRTATTGSTNCVITIRPPTLTATCAPDMNGQVGTLYSAFVTASGGSGGYTYALTGGSLPAGLILNPATGEIRGTPSEYGTFLYQVTVTDNGGRTATTGSTNCVITIRPPTLTLTCAPSTTGQVGSAYGSSLVANGGSGGYSFSISDGQLPPGLTLNASTGLISGSPTTYGTYTYTAKVTDSGGRTATTGSTSCTITIAPTPINLVCASATTGVVGTLYSSSLSASGGTGGYTYSISAGSLPGGLSLNTATGAITGTPTTAGTFNFTARVVDSTGSAATAKTTNCTISIAPPPVCVTSTVSFTGGTSASSGTAGNIRQFTSTGGVNVRVSAFSKKGTAWSTAYLGHYSPGLGVTDNTEGNGDDDRHKVDNIGGSVNYVMFEFASPVTVSRAFLDYIGADSDMSVWIGTKTDPYNNHISLNDSTFTGMVEEENLTDQVVTSRWADFNAARATGNVLIIAAWDSDDTPEDEFKIAKLEIVCPAPPPVCTGTVGDLVWKDTNGNGIQDSGEPGIAGITVQLKSGGTIIKTATTDSNGKYLFTGLCAGSYIVVIANPPSGYTASPLGKGTTSTDSNGSPATVTLPANNSNDITIDFGFVPPPAPPVCAPDTFVLTGSSQTYGSFGNIRTFNGQTTGLKVKASAFNRTSGGAWSSAYLGAYGHGLGVTDNTEGNGSTTHKVDNVGGSVNYVMFEFNTTVTVSRAYLDYIGEDSDITVYIGTKTDPYNNHITLSDAVLGGMFTESNSSSDKVTSRWADFNNGNVSGNVLVIAAYTGGTNDEFKISKLDIICQAPPPTCTGTIGDFVWRDTNGNGIQNSGELGIAGVTVQLKSGGTVIKTTTTNASGYYQFTGICSGTYTVVIPNPPSGYTASPNIQGTNRSVDSNGSGTSVTLSTSSSTDSTIDFGFVPPPAPVCTADTFSFTGGTSYTSGSAGNIRTFTSSNGVQVKASAFSRKTSTGLWANAFLGHYSSGLGVTDNTEGDGVDNRHKVDNIGGTVNYVLFEFSAPVAVNRAFLDAIGADSDISVWIGTKSNPFTNHITLSDSVLTSLAVSSENPTSATETSRWANFNGTNVTGNVVVISALATDDTPEDEFKLAKLGVTCISLGQYATYTQGGWGSTPSGNNPGALLAANFSTVYPGGKVEIGGTNKLTFTSASAINAFLPAGGTAAKLTSSSTNPTSSAAGVFAGQVLSLRLSVDFSNKGITPTGLGNLKIVSGKLADQTVNQVLATANSVLGGGSLPSGLTISELNSIIDAINNNFDGGVSDDGFLKF